MKTYYVNFCLVRIASIGAAICLASGAQCAETDWFNVSFDGYVQGQQLSDTGATGGVWRSPVSGIATNVNDGVRNGIATLPTMMSTVGSCFRMLCSDE